MSTPIWLKDPTILLKHDKLKDIWPVEKMQPEEKVNAITRLVILLTLLGFLLTLSFKIIYIGLTTLAIISIMYFSEGSAKLTKNEGFSNLSGVYPSLTNPITYDMNKDKFSKPSETNPMMNVLIPEIYYDPHRKLAAPTFNPEVEKEINKSVKKFVEKPFNDKNIDKKLFADLGDEIMFNRSMLQWTATPGSEIPNDQGAFQEYLYGNMISGKEGNAFALQRQHSGAYNYQMN
jgi:hypothetical protein